MMESKIITAEKKIKLYISCINNCPIQGQIYINTIIYEILYYYYAYETLDEILPKIPFIGFDPEQLM